MHPVELVPIRVLLAEGFLTAPSPRRVVVRELNRKDVENLFDLREALEVLAARRAAERADAQGVRELQRLLEQAHRATLSGRAVRISRANSAFHHHITALADNEMLTATLEPLEGRLRWLFQQIDEPNAVWEEHRLLTETVAAHVPDAAAACALSHVRHYRDVALRLLFGEGAAAIDRNSSAAP